MNTDARDIQGRPVRVRCSTCHWFLTPKKENAMARSLKGFHTKVKVEHGNLTCRSCHAVTAKASGTRGAMESFRLTSGQRIPYAQVMELCGQCHSRQRKDYAHGVHGGMTGHWDLDRGPRQRNHCLHCHNPHRPSLSQVMPAPRPSYRFLGK